jgi:hypothetical protein
LTLEAARNWPEAESAYREHLIIAPNGNIRIRLANVLRRQEKHQEADELLRDPPAQPEPSSTLPRPE